MKVNSLLPLLGLCVLVPLAWAQNPPPKPANKAPAKPAAAAAPAAAPAPAKTLSLGGGTGGSGSSAILSREELRACLKDEETIRERLASHDAARALLDQEKQPLTNDQQSLRAESSALSDINKRRADEFSVKLNAHNARVSKLTERLEAHNADGKGGGPTYERNRAALDKEREDIIKERAALETERTSIANSSDEAVRSFNVKATALEARVATWNERNAKWNQLTATIDAERKAWVANCADRRFREDDEAAIKRGK